MTILRIMRRKHSSPIVPMQAYTTAFVHLRCCRGEDQLLPRLVIDQALPLLLCGYRTKKLPKAAKLRATLFFLSIACTVGLHGLHHKLCGRSLTRRPPSLDSVNMFLTRSCCKSRSSSRCPASITSSFALSRSISLVDPHDSPTTAPAEL